MKAIEKAFALGVILATAGTFAAPKKADAGVILLGTSTAITDYAAN